MMMHTIVLAIILAAVIALTVAGYPVASLLLVLLSVGASAIRLANLDRLMHLNRMGALLEPKRELRQSRRLR